MTCPICTKASDANYRPFCSRRCADIDLGKWLTERYIVPPAQEGDVPEPDDKPPARH